MSIATAVAAIAPCALGMVVFGAFCLFFLRRANQAEEERDRLWDELHPPIPDAPGRAGEEET